MSNRSAEATVVASKMQELAEVLEEDLADLSVEVRTDFGTKTLDGEAVKEKMQELETPTESQDDPEGVEDTSEAGEDNPEGVEDEQDTIEDGEVACQCGATFGSRPALNGHLAHCDSTIEDGGEDSEDSDSTSEAGGDEVTEGDLLEAGVKPKNIEDVLEYRSKNDVCQVEDCPYGAMSEEKDHCASHHSKNGGNDSTETPKESRDVSDLSEAEMTLVSTLIEDEGKSLEEAISMV